MDDTKHTILKEQKSQALDEVKGLIVGSEAQMTTIPNCEHKH